MKRIVPIFLLICLLYNAFGYYALLAFEKSQACGLRAEDAIKTDYKIIRLPVSAYVHLEDTGFEASGGQFEEDGQIYNIVKQRRVSDTLEIYALRNERQNWWAVQINDFIKEEFESRKTPPDKSPVKQSLKSFLKDYTFDSLIESMARARRFLKTPAKIWFQDASLASVFHSPFAPPPETQLVFPG